MNTPSVTLKSVTNADTGIDISVPRFQEEEAPLGGVSILYEISVLTTLDLFKTRLHRNEDVVQFSIFKAYREIDDLSSKLNKKYPKAGLPHVPKASTADKYSSEEKVEALDIFVKAIAKNIQICHSSMFTQFIGINSQRLPSFNIPSTQSTNTESTSSEQNEQEVFHKMKNVEKNVTKLVESTPQPKADLFEEETKTKTSVPVKTTSSQGLFDEFEDDNLFSTKPAQKKPAPPKQNTQIKKAEVPVPKKQVTKPLSEEIDDSEIIIKDRKFGDVSLFEEQDFGDYITKEEEALFLVTAPTKTKQNFLLSSKNEILSPENEADVNENLDDLLNMVPLPVSPAAVTPVDSIDIGVANSNAPQKPVPLPRKKSLVKTDSETTQKPEVMPRRVFLNQNDDLPKSTAATPPSIPPKPTLAAKPKPPVKPKPPPKKPIVNRKNETKPTDLDTENANKPEANDNNPNTVSNLSDQLKGFDIMQYIEQEQKSLDSNLDLFD